MSDHQDFDGTIAHEDNCVVVALSGEIDMTSTVPFATSSTERHRQTT